MDRRALFKSVFTAGPGFLAAVFHSNAEAAASTSDTVPRVAYHLSDLDKAAFVLGNIRNHFDGVGGPGNVRIALVVHGPALRAFRLDDGNEAIIKAFEALRDNEVAYHACGNTMRGMKISLDDLLPGFEVADKGGVVKLAELQADGWLYLRP
jgi:intracellular sulfur oxidation DsrE/DsrF family protein